MALQKLRAGVVLAISIAATATLGQADATELLVRAYGPVERTDASGSISILGTTYQLSPNADALVDGRHVAHAASLLPLLSQRAAVPVAVLSADATLPASRIVVHLGNPYVAGATQVAAAGVVRAVDKRTARLWIEKTPVDYSAVLSNNPGFEPNVGDVVQVLGIRPSNSTVVLATRAQHVKSISSTTNGISGSGTNGISGSGKAAGRNGISGSGANGISGSGTNGISGSGTNGISGSGTNGISGSGANGISGSGTKRD